MFVSRHLWSSNHVPFCGIYYSFNLQKLTHQEFHSLTLIASISTNCWCGSSIAELLKSGNFFAVFFFIIMAALYGQYHTLISTALFSDVQFLIFVNETNHLKCKCKHEYVCLCPRAHECRGQRGCQIHIQLEEQAVVSHLTWELEPEFKSSGRAASILNHWAIESYPQPLYNLFWSYYLKGKKVTAVILT